MSIFRTIALCISLIPTIAFANPGDEFLNEGIRLRLEKQYLLSAFHFSQARILGETDSIRSRGLMGYALDMKSLGEKKEYFEMLDRGIENSLEPYQYQFKLLKAIEFGDANDQFSPEDQFKIKLWKERKNIKTFRTILDQQPDDKSDQLQKLQLASSQNFKTPWIAGTLSAVLPGAGQLYIGSNQSAVFSFVVNAIFAAATYEFANKEFYAAATASGAIFSITYMGNIFNAVRSTHRLNEKVQQPAENQFYQLLFPELKVQ